MPVNRTTLGPLTRFPDCRTSKHRLGPGRLKTSDPRPPIPLWLPILQCAMKGTVNTGRKLGNMWCDHTPLLSTTRKRQRQLQGGTRLLAECYTRHVGICNLQARTTLLVFLLIDGHQRPNFKQHFLLPSAFPFTHPPIHPPSLSPSPSPTPPTPIPITAQTDTHFADRPRVVCPRFLCSRLPYKALLRHQYSFLQSLHLYLNPIRPLSIFFLFSPRSQP